ncbi:hypothetical protein ACFY40_10920 [Streptomyces sp. NPDC012950]|uniref:hypothetical protein n=1 Tax=Streptomyces sp. NPDC012950 TaxID=3364858 RepID=UPI00369A1CA1
MDRRRPHAVPIHHALASAGFAALITRHGHPGTGDRAGDPAGAVVALEELLVDQLRVPGPDHPATLRARDNLAHWRERR